LWLIQYLMIFPELFSQAGDKDWFLFVDTSTSVGRLAALNSTDLLFHSEWGPEKRHDLELNVRFEELSSQLEVSKLHSIICSFGPGSFTGLRVSSIFSTTLGYCHPHIQLFGLSSFYIHAVDFLFMRNNLAKDFEILIPSIGELTFSSTFSWASKDSCFTESIDETGSKVRTKTNTYQYLVDPKTSYIKKSTLKKALCGPSAIRPIIKKFTYLDFYPLFLRRSEAEEKFKI